MVDFIKDAYARWDAIPNQYYNEWKNLFKTTIGYKKGGLVDYTGPAMVHGTSSSPEAFLNADQTALFANLRDILAKVAVGGDSIQSSINIENITIQTNQMNSNQDFKSAGETLAKAFNSAIKSRGINLNTKR